MAPKKTKKKSPEKRKASHPAGPSPAKPEQVAKVANLDVTSFGPDFAALSQADAQGEAEAVGGEAAQLPRTSTPLDNSGTWRQPNPLSPGSVHSSSDELSFIEEEGDDTWFPAINPEAEEDELEEIDVSEHQAPVSTPEEENVLLHDLSLMSVDLPEHPVNMVLPQAPSEAEILQLTDLQNDLEYVAENLAAPTGGRTIRAKKVLDALENKIAVLNKETMKRIAKLRVEEVKAATLKVWRTTHHKLQDEEDRLRDILEVKEGTNPANVTATLVAEVQSRITLLQTEITAIMAKWEEDLTAETADDAVLPKALYLSFKERLSDIKGMIRPAMHTLHQEKIALDIGKRGDVNTEYGLVVKGLDEKVADLDRKLHKQKLEDSTFANLTLNSTSGGAHSNSGASGGQSHMSSGSNSWQYLKREMPTFKATAGKYASWKKEMQEEILPGKGTRYQIRLIAELSPNPEVDGMFETMEETWEYMDNEHANSDAVSKDITTEFLYTKFIPGHNDQQKLCNLYQKMREMRLTLKNLNKESQLTEVDNMLGKLITLLPDKYAEEYNITKANDDEARDRILTDKEKYQHFETWMQKRAKHLKSSMSHLLKNTGKDSEDQEKSRKERKAEKDATAALMRLVEKQTNLLEQMQQTNLGQKVPGTAGKQGGDKEAKVDSKSRVSSATTSPPRHSKEVQDHINKKWATYGPCPCCKAEGHQFEGFKGWTASQSLQDCPKFMNDMTVEQRADFICKTKTSCIRCLSFTHNTRDCPKLKDEWYCRVMDNGRMCKAEHSNFLHGLPTSYKLANTFRKGNLGGNMSGDGKLEDLADEELENLEILQRDSMLAVVLHYIGGHSTIILLDGGSSCSIITNRHAKKLGLEARLFNTNIKVLGKPAENVDLRYYAFTMETDFGPKKLVLLGMDSLTEVPGEYSVDVGYTLFPHLRPGCLEKPAGDVDILIGQDNVDLLPKGGDGPDQIGGLMVQSIPFGPGKVLTGYHPEISFSNPVLSNAAKAAYHMDISKPSCKSPLCLGTEEQPLEFYEVEMMPFNPPPRCSSCMNRKHCTMQREGSTVKEKMELQDMADNIWHDPEEKTISVSYPLAKVGDIRAFRDNRHKALQRVESSYNSLRKKNMLMLLLMLMLMLMTGGLACQDQEHERMLDKNISKLDFRMRMVEDSLTPWWKNWMIQVWESLVPASKWRTVPRNVEVGDVMLVRYTSRVTKPEFRIKEVLLDGKGRARDVTVITRSRKGKLEDLWEFKPRKFDEQKLPVQRFAVLPPVEEQEDLPPADNLLHVCEDDMRILDLADAHARPSPIGPTGPTDSNLNVPPTLEEMEDTEAETVVHEPTQSVVKVEKTEEGLQSSGVFQVERTDTSEFISKLVNHAVVVRSPEFHCSECQVRHNICYNEDYYKQCFESENEK